MKTLLILAGGFGSRLREIVSDVPKPLAPVSNEPFLKLLLKKYIAQGASNIILLLHYKAKKIELMIQEMEECGELNGIQINTITEQKPLGTGGSILNAITNFGIFNSFLVANADTWLSKSLIFMNNSEPLSIASVHLNDSSRYGSLEILDNKVLSFSEKKEVKKNNWINAGIYHLEPSIFKKYKPGDSFSLENKILPRLASTGKLNVVKISTDFIDIGVPEDYFRFCNWIKGGKKSEL